jgi:DNA primase
MDNIVNKIRESISLVEIVSNYTKLSRRGRGYVGLCPFHSEKTPSFYVSPDKNLFYCFGCQRGGDVFKFLEYAEGLNFKEAEYKLAKIAGIEIKESDKNDDNEKEKKRGTILRILKRAEEYYYISLWNNKKAISYLHSRGLSDDTIRNFRIGYAPNEKDFIISRLIKNYSLENIQSAGLIVVSRNTDKFVNRIIFPIRNIYGEVIGFGGRVFGEGEPKYLNSPDTVVFRKGKVLYGLYENRGYMREVKNVFLVEGYFDLLVMYENDIRNVVATMGTALSESKLRNLQKYVDKVTFLFDGDEAGRKASLKAYESIRNLSLEANVVFLKKGYDPADFLLKFKASDFRKLLLNSKSPLEFKIDEIVKSAKNVKILRELLVNEIYPEIKSLSSYIEKDKYLSYIANVSQISLRAIQDEYQRFLKRGKKEVLDEIKGSSDIQREEKIEWDIIIDIINYKDKFFDEFIDMINEEYFMNEITRHLYTTIKKYRESCNASSLIDEIKDNVRQSYFSRRLLEVEHKKDYNLNDFVMKVALLKLFYLDKKIDEVKKNIDSGSQDIDVVANFEKLVRERKEIYDILQNK